MSPIAFHRTRRGTIAHFTADQCIGQSLQRYGEWAEAEIQLLKHYVAEGSTVLDIGANVGVHTLAFAQMVGRTGKVIAIEGQPSVLTLLAHNVVVNGLVGTVEVLAALVGQNEALVPHVVTPATENVGAKSFVAEVRGTAVHGVTGSLTTKLPLLTVDSLRLPACDAMKIDVEGMELDVLQGAIHTLCDMKPIVYFEHTNDDASLLTKILNLLQWAGYRMYWHIANPFNSRNLNGDGTNIFGGNVEVNVLALPNTRGTPPGLTEITDPLLPAPRPSLADGLLGVALDCS